MAKPVKVQWLDIMSSKWREPQTIAAEKTLKLECPGKGYWVVLVN